MKNTSLCALQESLVNLSKSDLLHVGGTAQQLRETRIALLAAEGVDMAKFLDYTARLEQVEKLDAEIATKTAQLESMRVQVEKLELAASAVYRNTGKASSRPLA